MATETQRLRVKATLCALFSLCALLSAQPLDRLTGRVLTDGGAALKDADVRVEAIFGFAGGDFLGQRTFSVRTNEKGQWALLAFKAGIWVFEASAPGQLPDAVALPFNLVAPPNSGVGGLTPAWHPILRPTAVPETAIGLLAGLSDSNNADVLVAAGRICLVLRDAAIARPLFRRALERDPSSFAAALGMGSTALMQRDVDSAAKAFGDARERTKDKDERSYLSAAINELNKAHNVMKGTY